MTWTNNATLLLKTETNTLSHYLTTATLFYKLLFILETLLLMPIPKYQINIKASIIAKQIHMFKAGHLAMLYKNAFTQTDLMPPAPDIPNFDDMSFYPAAQAAADQNNYHTAFQ
jgi:hypothetical protein